MLVVSNIYGYLFVTCYILILTFFLRLCLVDLYIAFVLRTYMYEEKKKSKS